MNDRVDLSHEACRHHMEELLYKYGECMVIDLLKKKGHEKALGEQFRISIEKFENERRGAAQQEEMEQSPLLQQERPSLLQHSEEGQPSNLSLVQWDFAQHCGSLGFDKVKDLVAGQAPPPSKKKMSHEELLEIQRETDQLKCVDANRQKFGYFSVRRSDDRLAPQGHQVGILRVNCCDSLDRTNVVQAAFAEVALKQQLKDAGVFHTKAEVPEHVEMMFGALWADNGDALSMQYTGTPAFKSDYTRTRQRTVGGMCSDLNKWKGRVYNSNYTDKKKQAVIDTLLTAAEA